MKKLSLTSQIALALILAIVAGMLLADYPDFVNEYIKPWGTIFLNLLKFIVAPLVFFSIMAGILSMNDVKKVGKLGLRAMLYFMFTTVVAVTLGLLLPSLVKGFIPVVEIASESAAGAVEVPKVTIMSQIVNMFPGNIIAPFSTMTMIQIIMIALFIGVAMVHVGEKGEMARTVMSITGDASCAVVMQRIQGEE